MDRSSAVAAGWLAKPAEPILYLGRALGIPDNFWPQRETLLALACELPDVPREQAAALTLQQVTPLVEAYGDALTCRFLLGDSVVLDVGPQTDGAALDSFRRQTRLSPSVRLELDLDKARLAARWLGESQTGRLFLYLFPAALAGFVSGDLRRLEQRLWEPDAPRKAVIVVPDHEIRLDGPYLAVAGGSHLDTWRELLPDDLPEAAPLHDMVRIRQETLSWQEPWLATLTPLHLELDHELAAPGDSIASALRIQLANLLILYTADRTVRQPGGRWLATYAGANQTVEVALLDPAAPLSPDDSAGAPVLLRAAKWVYEPRWAADRLAMLQISVAQALAAAEPQVRVRLLLANAAGIFDSLQWHWKAFVEGKVDSYVAQVRALEDYVASTVQAFADQVSSMVQSLLGTMLAAVAAVLGSFVAALFAGEFNPVVFRIGLLVYAAYVLVFPLGYNMLNQWGRYRELVSVFEQRRRRFGERLYPGRVDEIVGRQVARAEQRFRRWFWAAVIAYAVVVLLAVAAALVVPQVMATLAAAASP